MSSINVFQAAKNLNGPSGLPSHLLVENYDWVDQRLRELYYGYALTSSNCDEFDSAGLLTERWDWVDRKLEQMCDIQEEQLFLLCPAPQDWVNYREDNIHDCIEDKECLLGFKRKRSESSISDYEEEVYRAVKRLRCQSPFASGEYINYVIDNKFIVGNYDEECDLSSDVSSISYGDINCVSDDHSTNADCGEELEPFEWTTNCPIVSDDEDAESYYSFDSY